MKMPHFPVLDIPVLRNCEFWDQENTRLGNA